MDGAVVTSAHATDVIGWRGRNGIGDASNSADDDPSLAARHT